VARDARGGRRRRARSHPSHAATVLAFSASDSTTRRPSTAAKAADRPVLGVSAGIGASPASSSATPVFRTIRASIGPTRRCRPRAGRRRCAPGSTWSCRRSRRRRSRRRRSPRCRSRSTSRRRRRRRRGSRCRRGACPRAARASTRGSCSWMRPLTRAPTRPSAARCPAPC